MNIIIRNIKKEDIPDVVDININGWKEAYKGIVDDKYLENISREDKIKKREKDYKENGFIVAEIDKEVVGFCRYIDNLNKSPEITNADCELIAIYVKPKYIKKGIGKCLFEYVKNEFRQMKKTKMIWWCLTDNKSARIFYEKMGGKVIAKKLKKIGEKSYEEVCYCIDL